MDRQRLAGGELVGEDLAAELDPGLAAAGQPLQHEALAAKDAAAERALQGHAKLDSLHAAQEPVPVHQIAASRLHLDRHDLAGHLCGEGDGALASRSGELGHEQAAAGNRAGDRAPEAARGGCRGGGAHRRHP